MKNVANETVESTGNIVAPKSRKVGIDPDSLGVLMSLLTNQYTDKHAAVLREYFCNGWDSHLVSGNTGTPVEVSLPSTLQPSLLIQDKGRGLSEDELLRVYGEYLKSDKRQDSDTTGGFGIGSKSAWTMGQQFIVTGVKDGMKTVALFALDDNGMGEVDIMQSAATNEPNGVLVSLAVSDVDAMQEAAARFFETVDRGTALVDGAQPTPIWETDQVTKVNDQTWIRPNHEGEVYLVMGQVCYVVDPVILRQVAKRLVDTPGEKMAQALANWQGQDTSVYFKVAVDTVTPHTSRERLRDTEKTLRGLTDLVLGLAADLSDSVQAEVDAAPSFYEAARTAQRAIDQMGAFKISRKSLTYLGLPIPKQVHVGLPTFALVKKDAYSYRSKVKVIKRQDSVDREGNHDFVTLDIERAAKTLTITGVPEGEETKVTRYLKRYLEEGFGVTREYDAEAGEYVTHGTPAPEFVFVTDQPWGAFDWFAFGTESGAPTMTLDEYRAALKSLRTTSPRMVNEPSYTTGWHTDAKRDLDERDLLSDILSEGKDIVLFHEYSRIPAFAKAVLDETYTPVVLLPTQSEDALRKRVEADGSVKIADIDPFDVVREVAASLFQYTEQELQALAARNWLETVTTGYGHNRKAWVESWAEAFGDDLDRVRNREFKDALETVEIARLVAEDITEERKREMAALTQWVNDTEVEVPTYDAVLPDEDVLFPLLQDSNVPYRIRRDARDAKGSAYKTEVIRYINSK